MKRFFGGLLAVALACGTTQAASVSWGPTFSFDSVNGVEDIAAGGPILHALNFGEDPAGGQASITVTNSRESIEFTAFRPEGWGSASGTFWTGDGGTTGNADLDAVFNSHSWLGGGEGTIGDITVTDLTVGQAYQIQVVAAADTRGCCAARGQYFSDGAGSDSGIVDRSAGGSVIGMFTADADTQLLQVVAAIGDGGAAQDPGFSAVIVRAVPEPATGSMMLIMTLILGIVRRRR